MLSLERPMRGRGGCKTVQDLIFTLHTEVPGGAAAAERQDSRSLAGFPSSTGRAAANAVVLPATGGLPAGHTIPTAGCRAQMHPTDSSTEPLLACWRQLQARLHKTAAQKSLIGLFPCICHVLQRLDNATVEENVSAARHGFALQIWHCFLCWCDVVTRVQLRPLTATPTPHIVQLGFPAIYCVPAADTHTTG